MKIQREVYCYKKNRMDHINIHNELETDYNIKIYLALGIQICIININNILGEFRRNILSISVKSYRVKKKLEVQNLGQNIDN